MDPSQGEGLAMSIATANAQGAFHNKHHMSHWDIFGSQALNQCPAARREPDLLEQQEFAESTRLSGTESSSSRSLEDMDAVIGLECTRAARCCHRLLEPEAGAPANRHRALEGAEPEVLIQPRGDPGIEPKQAHAYHR